MTTSWHIFYRTKAMAIRSELGWRKSIQLADSAEAAVDQLMEKGEIIYARVYPGEMSLAVWRPEVEIRHRPHAADEEE